MTVTAPSRGRWQGSAHTIDTFGVNSFTPSYGGFTQGTWPTANMAIYVPVEVTDMAVVRKLFFASGTTGTGNRDLGLYDSAGTRLASSTSVAKGTTAEEIVYDNTDLTIGPGIYYMALAASNNTDTYVRLFHNAPLPAAWGVYTEASAFPLPATATFAVNQTLTGIPLLGMSLVTTIA